MFSRGLKFLVLAAFALAFFLVPPKASAQSEIQILEYAVNVDFPESITFIIKFSELPSINAAPLFLHPKFSDTIIMVENYTIEENEITWTYNLPEASTLPLFEVADFWVEIDFHNQDPFESPSFGFYFSDNRFEWNHYSAGVYQISYHAGDELFGLEILNLLQESMNFLQTNFGLQPGDNMRFYFYDQALDMQLALNREDIYSLSLPEQGKAFLNYSPANQLDPTARNQAAAEMLALTLFQNYPDAFHDFPLWLKTGMKISLEQRSHAEENKLLQQAFIQNELQTYDSLCAYKPESWEQKQILDAQAFSLVSYIYTLNGMDGIRNLLDRSAAGTSCQTLISDEFSTDTNAFMKEWESFSIEVSQTPGLFAWVFMIAVIIIPTFVPAAIWIRAARNENA